MGTTETVGGISFALTEEQKELRSLAREFAAKEIRPKAADALFEKGAAKVIVTATHGVLSGGAVDGLKNSRVSEVIVTNSLPIAGGIALFHERVPGGGLGALRVAAFALVVVGAAVLARGASGESGSPVEAGSVLS